MNSPDLQPIRRRNYFKLMLQKFKLISYSISFLFFNLRSIRSNSLFVLHKGTFNKNFSTHEKLYSLKGVMRVVEKGHNNFIKNFFIFMRFFKK